MKKLYKKSIFGNFRKGVLTASLMGAVFIAGSVRSQVYCPSAAGSQQDDEIKNVTLGSLTNASPCGAVAGPGSLMGRYSNYTGVTAPNLTQGSNYPMSLTVGQCFQGYAYPYSGYVGAWIDYNQNGSFMDAGEQIYMSGFTQFQIAGTVINVPGGITIPAGAFPGPTRMRVIAAEYQVPAPCSAYTFGETEDYMVNIVGSVQCNNTPAANTVVGPVTPICPNTSAFLSLGTPYLQGGVSYTWQVSTSTGVGPWAAINTATTMSYNTPNLNATAWYQLVAKCANGGGTIASTALQVSVAPVTISDVPYFEGFEDAAKSSNNELPNCSWTRTNPGNCKTSNVPQFSNRTPNTGSGYANFDYDNNFTSNVYHFYSNGIQLYAGVTYSAWVYYITPGWNAYNNFTLKYGPNQNQTGMVTLGSVPAPNNNSYKLLSNTFQVASSGIYYLNVSAQDNFSGDYFSFDDLGIIAPCTFTNNAANLSVNGPGAICVGQSANLTATGVNSYSWNTGATTPVLNISPINSSVYTVVGTNTLSKCKTTASLPIIVNPAPGVQIYAPKTSVCEGGSLLLFASGSATSYTWSNGPTTSMNTVTPPTSGIYSVIGANSYGCTSVANQMITVNALPSIVVTGNTNICLGEAGTLMAGGANSYKWSSSSAFLQTNPISPYPLVSTNYTVTGTDANECEGTTVVSLVVNACTGIANVSGTIEGLQVYPNPNNGEFTVELKNGLDKTIEVADVTGRIVAVSNSSDNLVNVNINNLSDGIYYIKVKSDNAVEVLKVVKQ